MKTIKKKRLRKKQHRKIIGDLCCYGSTSHKWRTKLFQAKVDEVFDLTQEDLIELMINEPIVQKYKFQFQVTVIPKKHVQVPTWLQDDLYDAVFKFYAKEFSEVYEISGNCNGSFSLSKNGGTSEK